MSWLPSFITPLAGAIAAVLSISSLLVLYFLKLRRREMPVSSTLLWKKAVQDLQVNAPFQKLRRNLLLLLQLLLLVLLCLALSRPVANFKRGAGKLTVILVDRSASMAAKDAAGGKRTRLEEAKRLAREVVDSMKRDDNACVIAFDETAETLCPLTPDSAKLRNAIDSIEQTDRKSRLKLAYQLTEAQAAFIPEQNRANVKPDVFLFSDGRAIDSDTLTLRGNLTFEKIGQDKTGNIAIVALSAKRNYENPTEVQVFARLANYGPDSVDADVNLSVATEMGAGGTPNYQVRSSANTHLLPERWGEKERADAEKAGELAKDSVEFKLDLTTAAVLRLEQMHKDGDALLADDTAQVVVPPPKALSVLLVTDGNFFLEKLKGSIQLKDFDVLNPVAYEDAKPAKYDVIIYDRYAPRFMPATGNFMFFRCVPPTGKITQATEGLKPVYLHENTVLDWKRDHPMLRDINLGKLYIEDTLKLNVPPVGPERLVEGSKGPLVVMERVGRSTHLIVGFDVLQSNWPLRMSFPVFMYQALQYLALGSEMDVREAFAPGATPTIPLGDVKRVAGERKEIRLNGPMGSRAVKIPEAGDFVLPALDKVGLYTIDVPVPGYDKMAVNLLDGSESNLIPSDQAPGGIGEMRATSGKSRVELWWWLAAIAVPLLLIEWFVYTRRVHL
ncbi:MAG TPA: VWA domain-containing protein [Tepidisphaeraceae bacterium]|jgi:uncharacterized protein YegL